MLFEVYHLNRDLVNDRETFLDITMGSEKFESQEKAVIAFHESKYDHVATVKVEDADRVWSALEVVFEKTNHISSSWLENDDVLARVAKARSTSVGDIVVHTLPTGESTAYFTAGFGFEELQIAGDK